MATFQVNPPENFNFKKPEDWPKWSRRFERFRTASRLGNKDEALQVSTLIYSMGDEADDILSTLRLTNEDLSRYETVKERFDNYFTVRRNVIFERAKFNKRVQESDESVDSFITSLYSLAEHCGYGTLRDELLRDRIVVGIRDLRLSEKLQLDSNLTLEKAVNSVRQSESIKKQQPLLHTDVKVAQAAGVDEIKRKKGRKSQNSRYKQKQPPSCTRCGRPQHSKSDCPAIKSACRKCKKIGHWDVVCRNKPNPSPNVRNPNSIHNIEEFPDGGDGSDSYAFLGSIDTVSDNYTYQTDPWTVDLLVDNKSLSFKIDTGADVTVIPESAYGRMTGVKLLRPNRILYGPGQSALKVLGKFTANMKTTEVTSKQEVFVVRGLKTPLLGRPAIQALNLVHRIHNVDGISPDDYWKMKFPKLFTGLGKLEGEYDIKLSDDAKPFCLNTSRRVPIPLLPKVKHELENMEKTGVISRVDQPTDWCAGIVVVPKSDDRVRICVDLTKLNESVRRENLTMPVVDQTVSQLNGARFFTKLDANSGFHQIPLTKESALLTTFITPYGRFCFNRLPFGISSAPEHFQKRMNMILEGLDGTLCQMDDILIYGSTQDEHDQRLELVLCKLLEAGVTLNSKCEFSRSSIRFLGYIIDSDGLSADPQKVSAISDMNSPTNVSEVRRFLGMVNQLAKFLPNLASDTKPLRELLIKDRLWNWDVLQQNAFLKIKHKLCSAPILAHYNPTAETVVSSDASSYGMGSVLLQKQNGGILKPVAYASRTLTPTEQRYAQVEKEALAVTWACERFRDFLIGLTFKIETDHKPLIPLLGSKNLEDLPPRIQRLRMRLMAYQYTIVHVPGKNHHSADALSRAPLKDTHSPGESELSTDVNLYVNSVISSLPVTEQKLIEIKHEQQEDTVCNLLMTYCKNGWPEICQIPQCAKQYWQNRGDLTILDGLLMNCARIVIPSSLRAGILDRLHQGHQGITKCRALARSSVWWPGLSVQLEELIRSCKTCAKERSNPPEPLIPSDLPGRPWQKVATDLFDLNGTSYLLVVDYYSRYIEIAKLHSTTSTSIINHLKSIFARHGIPESVMSDNGPQYSAQIFKDFADQYHFVHVTSSPRYAQSNGEAERAVQTIKNLLKKSADPYIGLMTYRTTPLIGGYSPSELLMGRRLRTTLPIHPTQLLPQHLNIQSFRDDENSRKMKQKLTFDQHHRARNLNTLKPGDQVFVRDPDGVKPGIIQQPDSTPRSYQVETHGTVLRRNRRHLIHTTPSADHQSSTSSTTQPEGGMTLPTSDVQSQQTSVTTRSGRLSVKPTKLNL